MVSCMKMGNNYSNSRKCSTNYSKKLLTISALLLCSWTISGCDSSDPTTATNVVSGPQQLIRIKHGTSDEDTNNNNNNNNNNNDNHDDKHYELDSESPFTDGEQNATEFDPKKLLKVNVVNKTVNFYKTQFTRVRSSLQDQIKEFAEQFRGGLNFDEKFSPELRAKLNKTLHQFINDLQLSPYCLASFNHLRLEMQEKRLWPLKFIDAMEFIPTGLLEGVFSMFGLYEECINIESPMVKWNGIRGKYCMAKIKLPFLMPSFIDPDELLDETPKTITSLQDLDTYHGKKFLLAKFKRNFDLLNNKLKLMQMINMFNGSYLRIGLCIPSTCSSYELENAINKFLDPIENPLRIEIEEECSLKDQDIQLDSYQLIALLVLGSLGMLVGACTAYEYYQTHFVDPDEIHKNQYDEFILSFSAISNTKRLMYVGRVCGGHGDEDDDLAGGQRLCAVDTLMMAFILLELVGRSYALPIFYGMISVKRAANGLSSEYFTTKKFFFLRGGSLAVTTYVLCSAITLAYNICAYKSHVKPTVFHYVKFAINRYLSLARRLIGPILLVYLVPLAGDGPIWPYFSELVTEPCKYNLWKTLLFVNNYGKSMDEVCLAPSVIFSAMFYLSLAAPFLLYALSYKYYGHIVFMVCFVLGIILSVIPKLVLDLPVAPYEIANVHSVAEAKKSFLHYYAATDQYVTVFVIGLFIGYLIKCRPNIYLGKRAANLALWIGLMALPVVSTSWSERFKPLEGSFSQFSFVTWFLLRQIMWCCGFGWIIFTCCTGRASPINEVLSLSWLRPFGKLALGVYLNHITILSFRELTKKEVTPLNHLDILTSAISNIMIAFVISYVFYLLIECPFYYWIKLLLGVGPDRSTKTKRFSVGDLENGKHHDKEEIIDLKTLDDRKRFGGFK